jgi:hypothetical protein
MEDKLTSALLRAGSVRVAVFVLTSLARAAGTILGSEGPIFMVCSLGVREESPPLVSLYRSLDARTLALIRDWSSAKGL